MGDRGELSPGVRGRVELPGDGVIRIARSMNRPANAPQLYRILQPLR
jgi:hypothetical protein